jgi:hypothetical protein
MHPKKHLDFAVTQRIPHEQHTWRRQGFGMSQLAYARTQSLFF